MKLLITALKFLLLPVTALVWCLIAYYAISYGVVMSLAFSFSQSWIRIIILYLPLIGLSYGVAITLPRLLGLAFSKLYGSKSRISAIPAIVYSVAGLCGIFLVLSFFYNNPPSMWQTSPMRTILLVPPYAGPLFSVVVVMIAGPILGACKYKTLT